MLPPLLGQLRVTRPAGRPQTHPAAVLGDKAYSSRAIRTHLRARGIKTVIPEPADQQGYRRRRGSAGGRPVGLDTNAYKGQNVIEGQYAHLKEWRGLAEQVRRVRDRLPGCRGPECCARVVEGIVRHALVLSGVRPPGERWPSLLKESRPALREVSGREYLGPLGVP